ncbi:hypothetical protein HHL16_12330 [Pseudoflavitalea sp. G-6-1-2]|nr:hypothetical protein [Pseudoflavitalea sp. G-6-1-2]
MLSAKIIAHCKKKGWWFEEVTKPYLDVLKELGIATDSPLAEFYLHAEDGPAFYSRKRELYHICWHSINSQYKLDLKRTHELLHISGDYLPLDSFEGSGGIFYNRITGEVAEVTLGKELRSFLLGEFTPQWKNFNEFLEWYFELN